MKQVSALMRWVGPVAIVGATFAVISDQLGLVVHLPEAGPTRWATTPLGPVCSCSS